MKLDSLPVKLFLNPEILVSHSCHHVLQVTLIKIGKLRLVALKELDIRILYDQENDAWTDFILKSGIGIAEIPAHLP